MTRLLFLSLALMMSIPPRKSMAGKYKGNCHKDELFTLELKSDSTFIQTHRDPATNTQAEGRWSINSDTLMLNMNGVYDFFEKDKKIECTVNDHYYILAHQMTKHLIKGDTLVVLWNRPDKHMKEWCNLVQTK